MLDMYVRDATGRKAELKGIVVRVKPPDKLVPPEITPYVLPPAVAGKPYDAALVLSGVHGIPRWPYRLPKVRNGLSSKRRG